MVALQAAAALAAGILTVVHIVTPRLRFLEGTPRSVWLSLSGGVSVAYVFVHLLPELAVARIAWTRSSPVELPCLPNGTFT